MNTIRELEKKIKSGNYVLTDVEEALLVENKYFLFSIMAEIAKNKIMSVTIMQRLKDLAAGDKEISHQGFGGFTVKITALATLVKLGDTQDYNNLCEEDREWVDHTLNDKLWKSF